MNSVYIKEKPSSSVVLSLFLLLTLVIYGSLLWWLNFHAASWEKPKLYSSLLICCIIPLPLYLYLLRKPKNPVPFKVGILSIVGGLLLFPSFLQTDQLRYIWDGILLNLGINPFAYSPQQSIEFLESKPFWHSHINHPELTTVYPPFAQLLFGFASAINPFFFQTLHQWNGINLTEFVPKIVQQTFWPAELGWRLILIGFQILLLFTIRHRRWDLVLFHPLFLLTALTNLHLDSVVLPLLALLGFHGMRFGNPGLQSLIASLSLLTRWTPALFLPFWLERWKRFHGKAHMMAGAAGILFLCLAAILLFHKGSQGNLFASNETYLKHWMFFGFVHRFLYDFMILLKISGDLIFYAKSICLFLFILSYGYVIYLWRQKTLSTGLASYLIYLFFLAGLPTLHPWYLLPLLVLGLPYVRVLQTVWAWPLLSLGSYCYYMYDKDLPWVRYSIYLIVLSLILRDLTKVHFWRSLNQRKLSLSLPN